jgi:transposase
MPRCLTIAPHLPLDELASRYRDAHNPVERSHWQMVWLVAGGQHCPAVARLTGYSEDWVRTIVHRFNTEGPTGLIDRRQYSAGHPPLLTSALREELGDVLGGPAPDGGIWTCGKVAAWMAARLGRPVGEPRGWEALRALGFTPQRPRPRATAADPAAQAAFKKGGSRPRSMRSGPPIRRPD